MRRDHLVPRHVIDKNGVTTTRWTKPDNGNSAVSLPSPVAPADDVSSYQKSFTKASSTIRKMLGNEGDGEYWDDISDMYSAVETTLSEFSEETLGEFNEFMDEKPHLCHIAYAVMRQSPETATRDFIHLYQMLDEELEVTADSDLEVRETLKTLDSYPELPPVNRSGPYPAGRIAPASAILFATVQLRWGSKYASEATQVTTDEGGMDTTVITAPGLAQLVIERPEDVERILALVEERGPDTEVIRGIFDHETSAVAEGLL